VLSIIAGARLAKLSDGLNHQSIVRSMPNTPAQIGEGVTMWTTTKKSQRAEKTAGTILGAMGKEFYASDEGMLIWPQPSAAAVRLIFSILSKQ